MKFFKTLQYAALMALSITMLYACGDSSSDSAVAPVNVSGSIFASYVAGARVTVKDTSGNIVAGPVTTDADGSYSIEIPGAVKNSDLIFESYSGTYTDEAFGYSVTAGTFCTYVAGGTLSSGSTVSATPASTVICELARNHKKTLTEAQNAFAYAFGYTPDITVSPTDMTAPAVNATDAQKMAGRRAGAFSQLIMNLGTLVAEDMPLFLTALAQDLGDTEGLLDGLDSNSMTVSVTGMYGTLDIPSDIVKKAAEAMFNKTEYTNSYKVEYIPVGMMGLMEGKATFQLDITDAETGLTGQEGLNVALMPMMYMLNGMNHSTPVEGCTDDGGGLYTCTLYYAMATMMNGESMGYWDLKVTIGGTMMNGMMMGGESVHFYPSVMMRMDGDTNKVKLKGQADMIEGMMGMPEQRTYFIYNDGATEATSGHDVELFIAAKESMMSFPALSLGTTFNSGTDYELAVTGPTSVEVSADGSTWVSATNIEGGHWAATGVTGLTTGEAGTVYVKLVVNDEQKTTDGFTADGAGNIADTNEYGKLTITPGV